MRRRRLIVVLGGAALWPLAGHTQQPESLSLSKTKATARPGPSDDTYLLTGQKNFGSGSGITSYMITVAVPEGEAAPDMFVLDMRGVPWDGSAGVTLTEPAKKSAQNIPKNCCRTTIAEPIGENASCTAPYRGSGRLLKPRPGRLIRARRSWRLHHGR